MSDANESDSLPLPLPSEVDTWPIDVRKLTKGQDLPVTQCEEILGARQNTTRYQFALMQLREWIMTQSAFIGMPLSISMRAGGLHVNTDGEASRYHDKLAKEGERSIRRNFSHLCRTVNTNLLTEHEKQAHEQHVRVWSLKTAALKGAARTIRHDENPRVEQEP